MKIHACLLGKWVCLNDDANCTIGEENLSPTAWYEENAPIWHLLIDKLKTLITS